MFVILIVVYAACQGWANSASRAGNILMASSGLYSTKNCILTEKIYSCIGFVHAESYRMVPKSNYSLVKHVILPV